MVVGYVVVATIYLLLSDLAVHLLRFEDDIEFEIGVIKGFGFVVVTALLLYLLLSRQQRQLAGLERLRRMLAETNRLVFRAPEREALFKGVCTIAVEHGAFRYAWIDVADASGRFRLAAQCGEDCGMLAGWLAPPQGDAAPEVQAAWRAVLGGKHVVVNDVLHDPEMNPWRALARRAGVRGFAAFPLRMAGKVIGALHLCSNQPDCFDGRALETLDRMAGDVSFGLDEHTRRQAAQTTSAVVESSPVVIFRWRTDAGWPIEFVSHNVERWGYKAATLMGGQTPFATLVHPDDLARLGREVERYVDERREEFRQTYRIVAATGNVRWVEDQTTVERDGHGAVLWYQGAVTDVTERHDAESALRDSEERLRLALDAAKQGIYDLDLRSGEARVTPGYAAMLGFDPATFHETNAAWIERLHPDDREGVVGEFRDYVAGRLPEYRVEFRQRTRNGGWLWILSLGMVVERDARGEPVRMLGTHTDITARKEAEHALRESESRYRALVEQSLVGIYVIDGGTVSYMNPRSAEIFGYRAGEVIGMPVAELVLEQDRPLVMENLRRRMDGEVASIQYEFQGLRKDGKRVRIGAHGTIAQVEGRRVVLGVLQDITEKRQTEETIRDYVRRLESAVLGTAAAVSQMVELRDPYTAGHERRVGELSAAIAAEMGLSEDTQRGLRVAGAVHDVGKIMVPAEILAKPGRLTAVEFELVKQHAQQGYEVLKGVAFPWPVAEVARQHHERMDGSGYPRGLKGDAILIEARIAAVADVVESMATHRPYRPALGLDAGLGEVEANAGRLFDQAVVDACLRLFREKGYRIPDRGCAKSLATGL